MANEDFEITGGPPQPRPVAKATHGELPSASEADALVALAAEMGLEGEAVRGLHADYLAGKFGGAVSKGAGGCGAVDGVYPLTQAMGCATISAIGCITPWEAAARWSFVAVAFGRGTMNLREGATAMADDLTALRRALHREPEIGLDLPRTQEKVLAALDGLPVEVTTGRALSSVTAVLRGERAHSAKGREESGDRPGPVVLLRADMDALPITEQADVPYRSRFEGAMHACGHDLHASMLVGAARLLATRRARLAGDVVFMFQPGEEGHDGARLMIEEGVLDAAGQRAAAAYALHVSSARWPRGTFVTRSGPLLAASDHLSVTVHGQGGHGSAPHRARDPVPVACEMVTALQTQLTRSLDPFDTAVLTVGYFHAGTRRNVIPEQARFDATVRTFRPEVRKAIADRAPRLCRGIAEGHGLEAEVHYTQEYPVTVTTEQDVAFAGEVVSDVFGADRFQLAERPLTASEDFSRVLERVPGAMVFLGATPAGVAPQAAPDNHSAHAAFDDAVLADGAALYAEFAARRLAAAS